MYRPRRGQRAVRTVGWRSFIRHGTGVWLYRPLAGGGVDFSTAYAYEVRWGGIGRVLDRWLLRPLMQRETERSFRRLARKYFPAVISRACNPRQKNLASRVDPPPLGSSPE